jgi:CRP/FNR family transcriptional regulator
MSDTAEEMTMLSFRGRLRTYARGQTIYRQAEPPKELYLLSRGRVELSHVTSQGKRLKLALIQPVTCFGEVPAPERTIHFATAEALEEAQVLALGRAEAEALMGHRPAVALHVIHELTRQLTLNQLRLVALAYYDVPTRVAVELARLSQEEQTTCLTLTHQALGERVGLLRESVTRTLHAFEQAGLVELSRNKIRLRDVGGLEKLLSAKGGQIAAAVPRFYGTPEQCGAL